MLKKGQIDLTTAIQMAKEKVMADLNCHDVGRIVSFYPKTQTADIEVLQVKQQYGQYYQLPILLNVPVIIYGSVNAGITLPDLIGTDCLLLFFDRNINSFLQTGQTYTPETARLHDYSDCVALCTFKTDVNPLQNYDNDAVTIYNNSETAQTYNKVYTDNAVINSTTTVDDTATTSNLNVNPNSILLENSQGGQIEINGKINIENTSQSLATLMQSFVTACQNITINTSTGALTPTSQQAFTDLLTQFQELLQ